MNTNILEKPVESYGFYSSAEAARIAQVPLWTLNSWRRSGIILPSRIWIDENEKQHIGHSFENVVYMRLIRLLREKNVSLFKAVKALDQLTSRFGPPSKRWATAKIFTDRKDVFVADICDEYGTTVATRYNQVLSEFLFGKEFVSLKLRADALLIPEKFMSHVEIDPMIQNGLPIILGTTIKTSVIHSLIHDKEYSINTISKLYPFIPVSRLIGAKEYELFLDNPIPN